MAQGGRRTSLDQHYLVDVETGKAIDGPMPSKNVIAWIVARGPLSEQAKYGNASRYVLAKYHKYPSTKEGDALLAQDIEKSKRKDISI